MEGKSERNNEILCRSKNILESIYLYIIVCNYSLFSLFLPNQKHVTLLFCPVHKITSSCIILYNQLNMLAYYFMQDNKIAFLD